MKLNKIVVSPEYENLFSFSNEREKIEHNAQMISYRILSEIERICDEKQIKKKDLAEMVGTSGSYITQLFRGSKQVNTYIMAKFEEALDITFEVKLKLNEETYDEFLSKQLNIKLFTNKGFPTPEGALYYRPHPKNTEDILNTLETESHQKQLAA